MSARVFISHAHEDDDWAVELRQDMRTSGYPFAISLVLAGGTQMRRTTRQLKNDFLGPRIRWSHVMLVLISESALRSDWVHWEVDYANEQRKAVLAVLTQLPVDGLPAFLVGVPTVESDVAAIWAAVAELLPSRKLRRHQRSRI